MGIPRDTTVHTHVHVSHKSAHRVFFFYPDTPLTVRHVIDSIIAFQEGKKRGREEDLQVKHQH